jgi:hypothetical protein
MSEEKEYNKKGNKLGMWALSHAVVSWGCMLGVLPLGPLVWLPILLVSAVTSVLSWKTALGKVAIVLLILEIPAYIVVHGLIMSPKTL